MQRRCSGDAAKGLPSIPLSRPEQIAQPTQGRVAAEEVALEAIEAFGESSGVGEEIRPGDVDSIRVVEGFHLPGRVAGHHHIRGHVAGHHRASGDDGVLAHMHALADGGPIPHPYVVVENDCPGAADGASAVVEVMPIGVGEIGSGSQHAAATEVDSACGVEADSRTQQAVVADVDGSDSGVVFPYREADGPVCCGDDVNAIAEADVGTVELQVPGFHDAVVVAERIELGAQKVLGEGPFEAVLQALDEIGSVIAAHALGLGCNAALMAKVDRNPDCRGTLAEAQGTALTAWPQGSYHSHEVGG